MKGFYRMFFLLIASSMVLANGLVSFLRTLPTSSGELLTQMYCARIIESKLHQDPLLISEMLQQMPMDPIRTPAVLATFHAWSKAGEGVANKIIESRFGQISESVAGKSIARLSTGLAAGVS